MPNTTEALDKYDRNILSVLQDNGRISFTDLGKAVGLTTTPCIERVRKLERTGFIKGYSARLSPRHLDKGLVVFVPPASSTVMVCLLISTSSVESPAPNSVMSCWLHSTAI